MSAISEYADRINATFDSISADVDLLVAANDGIAADVAFLKDTIAKLQSNPGPITPEDQALLDAAETRLKATEARVSAAAAIAKTLDDSTESPPLPPPAPTAVTPTP